MSTGLVGTFQDLKTILCICPLCGELVRVSDLHLSYRGKAPKTWLDEYERELQMFAKKEAEFEAKVSEIKKKAIERGRAQVVERACSCLDSSIAQFRYNPYDIKALFHPADFIVFNGLNAGEDLEDISFLSKAKRRDDVQKSLKSTIESGNYDWKVARVKDDGSVTFEL
jgi:predicted Holliday junction resolvase-like endonuclease